LKRSRKSLDIKFNTVETEYSQLLKEIAISKSTVSKLEAENTDILKIIEERNS
jgi:F0F1-type ATP synthase delta subunit